MLKLAWPYQPIQKLGEGSFGQVWKANDVEKGVVAAIKLLDTTHDRDAAISEAAALRKCGHKNILRFEDVREYEDQNLMLIITEFVDGVDLCSVIQSWDLNPKAIAYFTKHMLIGLQYLHDTADIIHCDIKPENILIDTSGEVKIADLGLSMSKFHDKQRRKVGTMPYIAPEILATSTYSTAVDIWSLGVTIFAMVASDLPDTVMVEKKWHKLSPAVVPDDVNIRSTKYKKLRSFYRRCMTTDPDKRPTASTLLAHSFMTCTASTADVADMVQCTKGE